MNLELPDEPRRLHVAARTGTSIEDSGPTGDREGPMDGLVVATMERGLGWRRRADRRGGVHQLVREVATDWLTQSGANDLKSMVVRRLRSMLPTQSVRLNELPTGPSIRVGQPVRARDYVAYAVPAADATRNLVLEASNAGEGGIDDWSCQLLETAASLVTLLFEAERAARWQIGPGSSSDGAGPLVGGSLVMQGLRERVERVATTDFTALVEGESGTGKELVARQIHLLSRRRQGPYVAINCAALVETLIEAELFGIEERTATGVRGRRGKFEYADNGTLFLDEVSALSMAAQA